MRKSHGGHQKSLTASIAAGVALLALVLSPVSAAYLFQASVVGQDFGGSGMQQGPSATMQRPDTTKFSKRIAAASKAINKAEKDLTKASAALDKCADKKTESSQLSCYFTNGKKAMNSLNTLSRYGDVVDSGPSDTRDTIRLLLEVPRDEFDADALLSAVSDALSAEDGVFVDARDAVQSRLDDLANMQEMNTNTNQEFNNIPNVPTSKEGQQEMMKKQMPTTPFKMNEDQNQMGKQKMFNSAPDTKLGERNFEGKDFNQFGITNPQTRTGITNPQTMPNFMNNQQQGSFMPMNGNQPFMPQGDFNQMGNQFMNQPPMGGQFNQPSNSFAPMNNQPPMNQPPMDGQFNQPSSSFVPMNNQPPMNPPPASQPPMNQPPMGGQPPMNPPPMN